MARRNRNEVSSTGRAAEAQLRRRLVNAVVDVSTLSGNSSGGGGIFNVSSVTRPSTLTVASSTLSGNSAFAGGGISNSGVFASATVTITSSTLSGNSAYIGGGGIYTEGLAVTHSRN